MIPERLLLQRSAEHLRTHLPAHSPAPEPRWHAAIAIAVTALVYFSLPAAVTFGPSWLLLSIAIPLEALNLLVFRRGHHRLNRLLGYAVSAILTAFVITSVVLLVVALLKHTEAPLPLLGSAAALWGSNVLIFALWYWRLDAGGPTAREAVAGHTDGAFLFPQMTREPNPQWSPQFIDYLFLAFNTSTAFSPTDVPVLSRWAKGLMMLQSVISLSIVLLLAGRAVNIM